MAMESNTVLVHDMKQFKIHLVELQTEIYLFFYEYTRNQTKLKTYSVAKKDSLVTKGD